jgi:hypothetical protein
MLPYAETLMPRWKNSGGSILGRLSISNFEGSVLGRSVLLPNSYFRLLLRGTRMLFGGSRAEPKSQCFRYPILKPVQLPLVASWPAATHT